MESQIPAAEAQADAERARTASSEQRFQALIEGLDAIVWEMDAATRHFTYVSPQAERLLGYARERWYSDATFWSEQLVHPEDREWAVPFCTTAAVEGRDYEFDYRAVAEDGRVLWLRDVVRVIRDGQGSPHLLRGVMVDITEEKAAEQVLRERARHSALSADVGSALADGGTLRDILQRCAQAMVEHLDAAFARIWTLHRAEQVLELQASAGLYTHLNGGHSRIPVGSFKIGLIAAERAPHLTNEVQTDPRVSDKEWARREGMVSFAGYPLLVEGQVVGVVAMFARHSLSDSTLDALRIVADRIASIVERKETELALSEREMQLAEAQRIAHLGSWEWDVGSNWVHWSDELFRIYGLLPQSEECTFDSYLARVHPDDRERVREIIGRVYRTGDTFEFEERIVRPDGSVRTLLSRGRAITDSQGQVRKLVGTCQDVTEQRAAAEREMELAREQAARVRAEEEEQRAAFLAEAGRVLSSSLDYATTLRSFAHLAVPRIADWCSIDIVGDDREVRRVVIAHSDPAKEDLALELQARYPVDPDAPTGVSRVLRTGEPELISEIPPELLQSTAVDAEHLRILRELDLRSVMVLPLIARDRTLGAITFVSAESGRRFQEDDLRFAQELAGRAALAVDNARLYREAEQARGQVTRILESITDAFFALDRNWCFSYLNTEAEALLHRSRDELLGRNLWEQFPEAVGSTFDEMYHRAVAEQRTVQFEEFYPPLQAWFEVRAYPSEEGLAVYFRNINERRESEAALQYQSYLTRTIAENATSALFLMDHRGHCTYVNPAAEQMIGFTLDEIRDMPLHDAIHHHHPDGRPFPMHECPIDRALPENFDIRAHEDVFIRKDGTFFPVVCAASPIFKEGVPVATVVEVRDVTQEKRAKEALEQKAAEQDALLNTIPSLAFFKNRDGVYITVNSAFSHVVDIPVGQIPGKTDFDLFPREQAEKFRADDLAIMEQGRPRIGIEEMVPGPDGQVSWVSTSKTPYRNAAGEVVGLVGISFDITDRKRMEAERETLIHELDKERTRLQSVFLQAPAVVALYHGPDHVITMANAMWEVLTGRPDALNKPFREVFPELQGSGLFELLDQVYETGQPFLGQETRVLLDRRGDGRLEETYWNFIWQPLDTAQERSGDILVHAVEVTDQVLARREVERKADELARLARQLEITNRELDQFAYVASHDLKAPLRGIANLSQWIEEDLEAEISPEVREHLDLLRGRVHRMEGLIDGILQYSRAGRVREKPETIDTGALLADVVDLLAPPEHLEVRIEQGMPRLTTERLPLQQVFLNLIGNAAKYNTASQPWVAVRATDKGNFVQFTVADNGPGIAPEYHERIFGIFQTLEARDKVEGTGIGLSLVKKIVEARGGQVWIESEEGAGAAFHFLWPKEASEL